MNILIVEDELLIAQMLRGMLVKLGYKTIFIAKNYTEVKEQLALNDNIDLCFLDINLSEVKSGIDVAHELKNNFKIPFIYLTSYSDPKTVKEASETLPEAYLLKPFSQSTLFSTLEIFRVKNENKFNKSILIKDGITKIKVLLNDILFIKSEKNYIDVYTTGKKFVVRDTIDNFIVEVDSNKFIRSHRSYAVNINNIDKIVGSELFMQNHTIPLSRNYKKEVLTHF